MINQERLYEADIIRLILIILLVTYHAFLPWAGGWRPMGEIIPFSLNWWIAKSAYAFMLECFVLVSGYIYGYQLNRKQVKSIDIKNIYLSKGKRLIIPSLVFSLIYILCFGLNDKESFTTALVSILEGRGHMWFLPMLFWCFIGIWIISLVKIKRSYILIILILLSVFSFVPLPLRLGNACYYMLFFYIGYNLTFYNSTLLKKISTPVYQFVLFSSFLITFISSTLLIQYFNKDLIFEFINKHTRGGGNLLICNLLYLFIVKILNIVYSFLGIFSVLSLIYSKCKKESFKIPPIIINFSTYCFGIYIFQQFILMFLYYHTHLNHYISNNLLPWLGLIITLFLSSCLSFFLLKTKVGKYLIG